MIKIMPETVSAFSTYLMAPMVKIEFVLMIINA